MVETGRSPNIEILTLAEVEKVEGEAGNFKVKVKIKPRYIDPEKCTACGDCMKYCPTLAVDHYNANLVFTRAVRIDFPQAVPTAFYIDEERCLRLKHKACQLCINVCGPKAIDFNQKPEIRELEVGAIILAPGFGEVKKEILEKFGWGVYSDVMTSMEVERMTCVSGPTEGEIIRPSDFKHPKKIAYIQCVGSRDESCGKGYCSTVCCMYAMKQGTVLKEHEPGLEITYFYMDVRTMGKGFDSAFENAIKKHGFKIVRARPGKIEKVGDKIGLSYVTEEGEVKRELYDLIVLSTGLSPPEDAEKIAKTFGIELNEFGFAKTSYLNGIETTRKGIYVVGAFQGPKDIPESVTQATGGSAVVSELLKEGRFSATVTREYPPEDEELLKGGLRIGVFICHCGVNIAGVVNVKEVVEFAKRLPDVIVAEDVLYSCAQDFLERLKKVIKEKKLNRVVVAACTPRTHEPLFQDTLREAGLNPALFEMANIRDQCSWVHAGEPEKATEKAKELVKMAVSKVRKLRPLEFQRFEVKPSALVIGGGVAGMTSALSVAEQGFQVYLVEKEKELGGNAKALRFLISGDDPQQYVKELIKKVEKHPKIKVFKSAKIEDISGYVGNFITRIRIGKKEERIEHGVIIVATGGKEYRPSGYPLDGKKVITQLELEERLKKKKLGKVKNVVMIQCAGSRGEELSYCSRVCCVQALKNALKIKEIYPEVDVWILYQDIRAYGFFEKYYFSARKKGVKFIRFPNERRPKVEKKERKTVVRVYDIVLGEELELYPDLVVLSVGIVPSDEKELFNLLKLQVNEEGFLMEAHIKLRPVETVSDGVYICGLVHGPQLLSEVIAQAKASAGKACIPLAKGYVEASPVVAEVEERRCIGCGICAELCPFSAVEMVKVEKRRKARVIKALCKGCGVCASHCPVFAIDVGRFTKSALLEQIRGIRLEEALEEEKKAEAGGK
jgi:heterodisulfide reductase subunit A